MHTFSTPNPVKLRVELWEGSIRLRAEQTDTTTVELEGHGEAAEDLISRAKVEQRGDEVVVLLPKSKGGLFRRGGHVDATIVVPVGSSAHTETASADFEATGELGDVASYTGSGEVKVEHAHDVEIRTGSGDIQVRRVSGSVDSKSGSAEVVFGEIAGDADVLSGSGDVVVDQVGGRFKVKAGSGDIVVKAAGDGVDAMAGSGDLLLRHVDHGRVKAKTGSGDIQIGVADGTAAYLDIMTVTGDVSSELDGSQAPTNGELTVEIHVQTGSGDVVLQRA